MVLFISPPFGNYISLFGTISIRGSFTIEPREGRLRSLRTIRYCPTHHGWINNIGLKNSGIKNNLKKTNKITSIAIINSSDIDQYHEIFKNVENVIDIEINISCPNVNKTFNRGKLYKLFDDRRRWNIIKLSPIDSSNVIDEYYNMGFRQFHCSNSLKLTNSIGSISGIILRPFVEKQIKYIKDKYPDCEIIAGGGIIDYKSYTHYKNLGAHHCSVSSLLFNPISFMLLYVRIVMKDLS